MAKGNILLLLAAAIWGLSLVSQQAGMELMGPWSFTGVRCTLGGISLIPLVINSEKKRQRDIPGYRSFKNTRDTIVPAFVCFIFLGATIMTQQFGLLYTGVGKGAFITAFYIFLTPVIGVFLGKKVKARIWTAVFIAVLGIFLLTMSGYITGDSSGAFSEAITTESTEVGGINKGDILMFIAAFAYAFYVHAVDKYTDEEEISGYMKIDTVKLSCMQMFMIGLFALIMSAILEPGDITLANCLDSWVAIVYAGVISGAMGFTFQMIGQRYTEAAVASILLSTETLFSLIGGWVFFHEVLTGVEYVGCAVMVVAIIMAVLPEKAKATDGEKPAGGETLVCEKQAEGENDES